MSWGNVAAMGHIRIRTSDIEQSVTDATQILGLRETGRDGDTVYMSASGSHHELAYVAADTDGLDRLGLVAANGDALRTLRRRVEDEGLRIIQDRPSSDGIEDGFSFIGPEGYPFEALIGMQDAASAPLGFGPKRFGHINIHPQDPTGMARFLQRVLDFRVSDVIGTDYGYFLRSNVEHHGIAVIKGRGTIHHHAWEVQGVQDLTTLGDRLHSVGKELLWGPVRHGAGQNIAAYYLEHSGNVVELYTDIEMIYDDDREPVVWGDDDVWWNEWNSYVPDGFRAHGLAPVTAW